MQLAGLHRQVMMDARVLHDAVNAVFPVVMPKRYRDRAFNLAALLRQLNTVTEPLGVVNELIDEYDLPKRRVTLTAQWLPEDQLPFNGSSADVRLEWHVHARGHRQMWTPKQWTMRRFYFWAFVMHEFVHRHQDIARDAGGRMLSRVYRAQTDNPTIKADQIYLGDYDEIEAHAHDVALEMRTLYPDLSCRDALLFMKTTGELLPLGTVTTYQAYKTAFTTTPKHPAIPVFHRKIKTWWHLIKAHQDFYQFLQLECACP